MLAGFCACGGENSSEANSSNVSIEESKGEMSESVSDDESKTENSENTDKSENPDNSKADSSTSKDESKTDEPASKDESKTDEPASKDESKTDEPTSKDESKADESTSKDESKSEEASSKEESKEESKSEDSSKDESKEPESSEDDDGIIDEAGYEQFLKISEIDKNIKDRGFKDKGSNSDYIPLNYDKMKAMWISQFDFGSVYCGRAGQNSEATFRVYVQKAFDNLLTMGFNTVIVQVRPNADSFCPSSYYPWSHYVVGSYGKVGKYDPLEIMIEEAHERKISFQAWINPMRGMSPRSVSAINKAYPIAEWNNNSNKDDYLYTYNSLVYLNIAYEEVRNLIINGAAELVRYYDVDGIHMDDYFYFGREEAFDKKAYEEAKKTTPALNIRSFRFKNLNTLVSGIYSAIKEENKNVIFGISPAGNIDNMATTYYADVKTWLSNDGYVDYIMPQIYFGMEHQSWSFSYTYNRWVSILKNDKIKFMPGITFSKAIDGMNGVGDQYAGSGRNEWIENKDVMKRCLEFAVKQEHFDGFALFSYTELWGATSGRFNTLISEEVNNSKAYFTDIIKGEVIKY